MNLHSFHIYVKIISLSLNTKTWFVKEMILTIKTIVHLLASFYYGSFKSNIVVKYSKMFVLLYFDVFMLNHFILIEFVNSVLLYRVVNRYFYMEGGEDKPALKSSSLYFTKTCYWCTVEVLPVLNFIHVYRNCYISILFKLLFSTIQGWL